MDTLHSLLTLMTDRGLRCVSATAPQQEHPSNVTYGIADYVVVVCGAYASETHV
jgi:hypothetical protein